MAEALDISNFDYLSSRVLVRKIKGFYIRLQRIRNYELKVTLSDFLKKTFLKGGIIN